MQDTKKLMFDFKNFNKKLRTLFDYEYIAVAEPQKRGAWHLHIIMIFKTVAPYIPVDVIVKIWRKGGITVEKIEKCDNLGAYLSAYLTNIKDGKKTKKGQRLNLYPNGFRIYRLSKNIKKPLVNWYLTNGQQIEFTNHIKTYEQQKTISLENGDNLYINYMQYNKKK